MPKSQDLIARKYQDKQLKDYKKFHRKTEKTNEELINERIKPHKTEIIEIPLMVPMSDIKEIMKDRFLDLSNSFVKCNMTIRHLTEEEMIINDQQEIVKHYVPRFPSHMFSKKIMKYMHIEFDSKQHLLFLFKNKLYRKIDYTADEMSIESDGDRLEVCYLKHPIDNRIAKELDKYIIPDLNKIVCGYIVDTIYITKDEAYDKLFLT